jgi:hypothetical protein
MKTTPLSIDSKFKDLVHYVCAHGGASLGATKLNKILWLLDSGSYIKTGKPITDSKYVRRDKGPVPAQILYALDQLQHEQKIAISQSACGPYMKRDYLSLVEPDTTRMTRDELSFVQFLIEYVCQQHTAASISDLTHDIVWEAAQDGEEIPLYATLAAVAGEITENHMKWADSVVKKVAK